MFGHSGAQHVHVQEEAAKGAATFWFKKIPMAIEHLVCIQINWEGDANGTLTVEGSNHESPTDEAAGTREWIELPATPSSNPAGAAGTAYFNIAYQGFAWIRVKWTRTAGTAQAWKTRTVIKTPRG